MKIASCALHHVERVKESLQDDGYNRTMYLAKSFAQARGANTINIMHIEKALIRVVGKETASKLIHPSHDRQKAENAVCSAVLSEKLPRAREYACASSGCTQSADVYHHWSYLREHHLCVIPLCDKCHGALHAGKIKIEDPQKASVYPEGTKATDISIIDIKMTPDEYRHLSHLASQRGTGIYNYLRSLVWPE